MNTKWHRKCSSKAPNGEETLKSVKCIKWSKMVLYYDSIIGRHRHIIQYENTVKTVNVQEGQQHIITPQTASQHGFTGCGFTLHNSTGSRCPQITQMDSDVIRGLQMNTGKTDITSTNTQEQEPPKTL